MPEIVNNKTVFSLIEVTGSIQKTLSERYKSSFWIKAEMLKLNLYTHSGHCYPELVEKKDGKVIAQIKSTLWRDNYEKINDNFLKILKEPLKDGINILFCAKISYDSVHGISLKILDIDPSYSLGELEREKQETINRIKKERIFDANKKLKLPLLPKRVAVISVETSKGYSDFLKVIKGNSWNYNFFIMLFPALLQGEKAVESIINQLNRIKKVINHFDVITIIRGGGGDVGLSCYNNYQLVKEVALFPVPVITGIGHSTNETVVEMVSFKNAITPTGLADLLIQKFHNFSVPVQKAEDILTNESRKIIKDEKLKFENTIKYFRAVTNNMMVKCNTQIQNQLNKIEKRSKLLFSYNKQNIMYAYKKFLDKTFLFLRNENKEVGNIEKSINMMDPQNVLKRGYSITLHNGKVVKNYNQVKEKDLVDTLLFEGRILSIVKKTNKIV